MTKMEQAQRQLLILRALVCSSRIYCLDPKLIQLDISKVSKNDKPETEVEVVEGDQASKDKEDDKEENDESDDDDSVVIASPWNAVCSLGLRVFTKTSDTTIEIATSSKAEGASLEANSDTAAGATA